MQQNFDCNNYDEANISDFEKSLEKTIPDRVYRPIDGNYPYGADTPSISEKSREICAKRLLD